jgi:protein-disulfide isomerase
MILRTLFAAIALAFLLMTPASHSVSAQNAASAFSPEQKKELEGMMREYLLKNPEVVQEAMIELERRQKETERLARLKITQDKAGPLFASRNQMVLGNPKGDVTLVEFFDYNCGYCKKALADKVKLLDSDKNLRIILKEFPVLGQGSVEASQVAAAARDLLKPEKMLEFHRTLLSSRGSVGRDRALEVAKEMGLDTAKITRDMASVETAAAIQESVGLADSLGLTGTPSYVVGDEVIVGAVGFEELKSRIEMVRKCGKASC